LRGFYGIPIDEEILRRARQQIKDIDVEVNRSRKLKEVVNHLETYYDAQSVTKQRKRRPPFSGSGKLPERNGKPLQTGLEYLVFQSWLLCYNYQQMLTCNQYLLIG